MDRKKRIKHDSLMDGFRQFMRNGKWGTCVGCPRDNQNQAYPEFCQNKDRYDHQLTAYGLTDNYKNHMKDYK